MTLCEKSREKGNDKDDSVLVHKQETKVMDMICRSLDDLERSAKQDISQDNFNPLGLDLLSAREETGEATVLRLRSHWC